MSLINKALKGSMILTMGDYAVYAFNIVAQLWLIRLLSPSQYGQYAIISAIVEFAYVLLTIEFATACIYYLDNEDIFHTAVILAWIWSVGMVVALYGLRYITTFWINEQNWVFASILVLLKFIYGISVVYGTYIERHLHFGKLTIVRSLAKLIALGCGIVIAKRGGGIKALVCIDMINYLLASLTIIAVSPLKVKLSSFRFDLAKLILKKGFSQFQFRISGIALYRSPALLVQIVTKDVALVGLMDRAMYLALLINSITSAFTTKVAFILFKKLHEHELSLRQNLDFILWLIPRIFMPVVAVFMAYPYFIVSKIYGKNWISLAPLLTGLSIFSVLVIIYNILNQLYMAIDHLYVVTRLQWIMLLAFLTTGTSLLWFGMVLQALTWIWSIIFIVAVLYLIYSKSACSYILGSFNRVFMPIFFVTVPGLLTCFLGITSWSVIVLFGISFILFLLNDKRKSQVELLRLKQVIFFLIERTRQVLKSFRLSTLG